MNHLGQMAVFGSEARGGSDSNSDFDVIAVLNSVASVDKCRLLAIAEQHFNRDVGLSIYSERRLKDLWNQGSPFAWHLHLQSVPVHSTGPAYFRWGSPAEYANADRDCELMLGILRSASERLISGVVGAECYEAGLLYVCARNIGMFASKRLTDDFNFSRYAPYSFADIVEFPIALEDYSVLVACRHASTRGALVPGFKERALADFGREILNWARKVQLAL